MNILLGACQRGTAVPPPHIPDEQPSARETFADEERFVPTYDRAALARAVTAERGAEASAERQLLELETREDAEGWRIAAADLAVRRRFLASLVTCETDGRDCPPRLDEPSLSYDIADDTVLPPTTAPLRFDLASWRVLADELHGRACACRTVACLDAIGPAIDRLESRPTPAVQADDAATLALTRARECVYRLRGKTR